MQNEDHIAVLGAGAMGGAIIGGLLRTGLATPGQLVATDPRAERQGELRDQYGIGVGADNLAAIREARLVIVAVKPQVLPALLPPLAGGLRPDACVISVAAGVPINVFVQMLQHPAVVRAMPNTPAQIGEGMTVWTAAPAVSTEQLGQARAVLAALGREHFVAEERYLDMATAISGSGPAYIFLVIEAMIDAGVHMGFARPVAEDLAVQTVLGAARYMQQSGQHPAQLRNGVTSPAGTTAAGLAELERGALRALLHNAIWAAYRRSCELGGQKT